MHAETILSGQFEDIIAACMKITDLPETHENGAVFIIYGMDTAGYRVKGFKLDESEQTFKIADEFAQKTIELECLDEPAAYMFNVGNKRYFGENLHHGASCMIGGRLKMLMGHRGRQ